MSENINSSFILEGVTTLNRDELGPGYYGKTYTVKYCKIVCTAREIQLIEGLGKDERRQMIESYLEECRQYALLRHPNIVQFLGVYYPNEESRDTSKVGLPVMVMEVMAGSLASYVIKHQNIPVHIKYSIVHDVSLGLCYLHNHNPPIIHQNLSPDSVQLTAHPVAKISDLVVTKLIKAKCIVTREKALDVDDFMSPEVLADPPQHGPPMDVFSLAGIILHTFNQQWPRPTELMQYESKMLGSSEVKRRQQYLDKMATISEALTPLVEECLNYDPALRPNIINVCKRIQVLKDAYVEDSLQDNITLYQQNAKLRVYITQKRFENEQLRHENVQMNATIEQMVIIISAF